MSLNLCGGSARVPWVMIAILGLTAFLTHVTAAEKSPIVTVAKRKLEAGDLTPEVAARFLELICTKGDAEDLAFVFEKTISAKDVAPAIRDKALAGLLDAMQTRKIRPSGNVDAIANLIAAPEGTPKAIDAAQAAAAQAQRITAMRLAGLWKVAAAGEQLRALVAAEKTSPEIRRAAVDGLVALADEASRAALTKLAVSKSSTSDRILGVAGLAAIDPVGAAPLAAAVLKSTDEQTSTDDLAALVSPFLDRQAASDALAKSIETMSPSVDTAKRALQVVYATGHGSSTLAGILSTAAGLGADPKPLTPDEFKQVLAEVATKGNADRGEQVFRRADLSCTRCHSINKAGGEVGPDLSAVGSISPADFLLTSVLDPDQAIKEVYQTRTFITVDGEIVTGIVVKRSGGIVELKEATGAIRKLPEADIDQEKEGKSLMPKGLVKFMTRQDLVDLVRFLSELGKPGTRAVRTTPLLARWRLLKHTSDALQTQVPDAEAFRSSVLSAPADSWFAVYAQASGSLPIDDFARLTRQRVVYLYGEIGVTRAGSFDLSLGRTAGVSVWIDDRPAEVSQSIDVEATTGRRKIFLRVDTAERDGKPLCVEPRPAASGGAEFTCVGGP